MIAQFVMNKSYKMKPKVNRMIQRFIAGEFLIMLNFLYVL